MIELNFRSIRPSMLPSFHFASIVGLFHFSFFQPGLHFLIVQSNRQSHPARESKRTSYSSLVVQCAGCPSVARRGPLFGFAGNDPPFLPWWPPPPARIAE